MTKKRQKIIIHGQLFDQIDYKALIEMQAMNNEQVVKVPDTPKVKTLKPSARYLSVRRK